MKPNRNLLPAATGILGLLLGALLGLTLREPVQENLPASAISLLQSATSPDPASDNSKTNIRTRAKERVADKRTNEPRVSIPIRSLVQGLKDRTFTDSSSDFRNLRFAVAEALNLIGGTEEEQKKINELVEKSEADILAAEKIQVKLGEVTSDSIQLDISAMRGPVDEITGRIKEGILTTLPPDLAEALNSAIKWPAYYPTDEESNPHLEIIRMPSGQLFASQHSSSGGGATPLPETFKDDGTPLPAERLFDGRWKPILKGVTILPKDQESSVAAPYRSR